jgi:hypothetical protein
MNKTERQIRQIRALVNALMVLKRNTRATPFLKGLCILGTLKQADRAANAQRNGIFPDECAAQLLNRDIEYLSKMLQTANELISGERVWIG